MSRSRYSGAHAAKPAEKPPARRAPSRKTAPRRRPAAAAVRQEKRARSAIQPAAQTPAPRRRPSRRLFFFLGAIAAALLLALVALALHRPLNEGLYEKSMEQAAAAVEQRDWDNALRYLRRAASVDESEECLLLMASCYEQENRLDKALELLRKIEPSNQEASARILAIEERKTEQKTAQTVNVLGLQLPPDTTDLVLDERGLTDLNLEEIVQLYALDSLSLIGNPLTDISPLTALGSLDVLNLSGCRVADLSPLQEMTGLRALYLDGNPVEDLSPLYALQNLTLLSVKGCGVGEKELKHLAEALPACAILSDASEGDASEISLGGLTFRSDVEELDLSGRSIRDISVLAACQDLKRLNLSGNEIVSLQGLMNLPRLNRLDISSNQVGDLRPLIGLETLRTLNASDNVLSDTSALSAMNALQSLNLSGNPIQDFSGLRRLTNLTTLRLADTGLDDEGLYYLSELSMLSSLNIDDNPNISNEAFGRLQSSLPDCTISHTELVYSIPIGELLVPSNVTELDLSGRGTDALNGVERLNHLEVLDLSRNQIEDLSFLSLSASKGSIRELNLAFNQIGKVAELKSLSVLENLNLYGNPLEGVQTLKDMGTLRRLNVGSCGLSEEQLRELREALPECEIVLEN